MKKSTKISLLIIIIGIIVPWATIYIYSRSHSNDYQFILQCVGLSIMLFVSIYLFFTNIKLPKKNKELSKLAPLFALLSIITFFYSLVILIMTLAFRNFSGL